MLESRSKPQKPAPAPPKDPKLIYTEVRIPDKPSPSTPRPKPNR